jgi:hypothetical protein
MNMYAYVGADPVNFTDPNGLQKEYPIYGDPCRSGTCYSPGDFSARFSREGRRGQTGLSNADEPRPQPNLPAPKAKRRTTRGKSEPTFCSNPIYRGLDFVDNAAGYGQLVALGGGAMGQTEQYAHMRAAFRAGALRGYFALGAVRDFATVGKFLLGDGTTVPDLIKTLGVRGLGLDKAREVLADAFGGLAKRAGGRDDPCGN